MKKKYWLGGVLSAMVIVGGVAMVQPTLAAFMSQDSEINEFEAGNVKIQINESDGDGDFDGCTVTTSPQNCTKQVSIQNITSNTDAIIRVAIVPYWVEKIEEDGNKVSKPWPGDVSSSVVQLNFAKNYLDSWVDGGDGYYYYNELVSANEETEQLLSSVTVTIPQGLENRYEDKTLIVDVKAEAVQPTLDAVKAVWPNLSNDVKVMIEKMDGIK